jgi:hypothetical protein
MTTWDGAAAAASYSEIRQYCSTSAQAFEDAGLSPVERWDESGGTAFYWPKGDTALARFLREAYALSARARSGRTRGRPGPMRGTRTFSSTGSNCGESPRCPAVITVDRSFWPCSTARCSLVVNPQREGPSP